jgi:hypothetical protein
VFTSSTYLIRLTRVLVLGAVLAGTTASVATAQTGCPCNRDLPLAQAYQQNDSATSYPTPLGLKADGLRWQGIAKVYQQNHLGQAVETGSVSQSTGFDWADYAIGIGSGMGLMLVLAGGLAIGRQRQHRTQTA